MSTVNLQALIDQVLSMAQASINSRGNPDYWSKPSWDQLKEENYWTEIRKRNTQLAVDKQKGGFDLEKQELANAGEIARQTLASQSAANVAEITGKAHLMGEKEKAEATRYSTDKTLEAHKKLIYPEQIKGWTAILADVTSPEADKAMARANLFKEYNTDRLGSPKAFDDGQDVIPANPNPAIKSIKTIGSPIPASPAPVTTKTGGAKSMEFRSGLSPEEKKNAKERSTKNLLYGTKPQNRGWLDSLFN